MLDLVMVWLEVWWCMCVGMMRSVEAGQLPSKQGFSLACRLGWFDLGCQIDAAKGRQQVCQHGSPTDCVLSREGFLVTTAGPETNRRPRNEGEGGAGGRLVTSLATRGPVPAHLVPGICLHVCWPLVLRRPIPRPLHSRWSKGK